MPNSKELYFISTNLDFGICFLDFSNLAAKVAETGRISSFLPKKHTLQKKH
jgi:hypothetical protein